jgi:hypothetical protein
MLDWNQLSAIKYNCIYFIANGTDLETCINCSVLNILREANSVECLDIRSEDKNSRWNKGGPCGITIIREYQSEVLVSI